VLSVLHLAEEVLLVVEAWDQHGTILSVLEDETIWEAEVVFSPLLSVEGCHEHHHENERYQEQAILWVTQAPPGVQ
jgi:hypothetical protein